MDFNKVPRWALIWIGILGLGACTTLISTARADLDKFKTIAADAKIASDSNAESVSELKESVKEIRLAQETFRKEYREDQKDMQKSLADIARAVKA